MNPFNPSLKFQPALPMDCIHSLQHFSVVILIHPTLWLAILRQTEIITKGNETGSVIS